MAEQEGTSVMDVVSESRFQATFALRNLFGVTDIGQIKEWVTVITAMQELPKQFIDDVAAPIITRFFEDENLDPKKTSDRDVAAPFAPVIAASISTAAQAIFQQMQQQAMQREQSQRKILSGNGGLI